mmetsp:Transcript_28959/g.74311  ORF Transcript_28959/g.74311 Transcript_28959/m.74311 type:complete len:398 (-) Transcript_28959:958-2151(-)
MPHISHGGRYREVSQLLPGRLQVDVHAPEREVAAVHRHRLPAAHILCQGVAEGVRWVGRNNQSGPPGGRKLHAQAGRATGLPDAALAAQHEVLPPATTGHVLDAVAPNHAPKVLQGRHAADLHVQERSLQLRQVGERGVTANDGQRALLVLQLHLQVGLLRVVVDALVDDNPLARDVRLAQRLEQAAALADGELRGDGGDNKLHLLLVGEQRLHHLDLCLHGLQLLHHAVLVLCRPEEPLDCIGRRRELLPQADDLCQRAVQEVREAEEAQRVAGGRRVEDDAGELGVLLLVHKVHHLGDGDALVEAGRGRGEDVPQLQVLQRARQHAQAHAAEEVRCLLLPLRGLRGAHKRRLGLLHIDLHCPQVQVRALDLPRLAAADVLVEGVAQRVGRVGRDD